MPGHECSVRRFLNSRTALVGAVAVLAVGLVAIVAPLLPLKGPADQDYGASLASPGRDHLLGTDRLGRDTLSRLLHGARTSLAVGVLAPAVVLVVGVAVGVASGMAGSRVDNILMRGVDIAYALPDLLLIILLRSIFGGSVLMLVLAIGLATWPGIARLARGQTLAFRERQFVVAARVAGAGTLHVIRRHLLPNTLGPVVVAVAYLVPVAIFAEASLSFIGIGVSPPTASWGSMVQEGYSVVFAAYEQVLFPCIAIAVVAVAFTLLGDGLRDYLDPRVGRGRLRRQSAP